jgi:hypothetical protein
MYKDEAYEVANSTKTLSFYYMNIIHTIEIRDDTIKYLNTGITKKISLPDGSMRKRSRPWVIGAKIAGEYLVIYGINEVVAIKLENIIKPCWKAVRSKVYYVSKAIDASDWKNTLITDVVNIKDCLIAVGLTCGYPTNKKAAVAFIDVEKDIMTYTDKFGNDVRLVKLVILEKDHRVLALCDNSRNLALYDSQLVIYGKLEIYIIDIESAIVVSKKVVD